MRYQFVSICPIKYILDMELQSFPLRTIIKQKHWRQIYEEIQREIEGLKLENDILRNYKRESAKSSWGARLLCATRRRRKG